MATRNFPTRSKTVGTRRGDSHHQTAAFLGRMNERLSRRRRSPNAKAEPASIARPIICRYEALLAVIKKERSLLPSKCHHVKRTTASTFSSQGELKSLERGGDSTRAGRNSYCSVAKPVEDGIGFKVARNSLSGFARSHSARKEVAGKLCTWRTRSAGPGRREVVPPRMRFHRARPLTFHPPPYSHPNLSRAVGGWPVKPATGWSISIWKRASVRCQTQLGDDAQCVRFEEDKERVPTRIQASRFPVLS